jgi:uncharacterized protein (TIGR03000 family)
MAAPPAAPAAAYFAVPAAPPAVAQVGDIGRAAPVAVAQREVPAPVSSRITVRLPQSAKLYVNDDLCTLRSETRSFETPQLKADKEYRYTLRAEVVRNGQTVSEIKKVVFKAGQPVDVEFKEIGAVRTAQR